MKVTTLHGQVVISMDPRDAHSFGCWLAELTPDGDSSIEDAYDIIREAHLFDVCPSEHYCPLAGDDEEAP